MKKSFYIYLFFISSVFLCFSCGGDDHSLRDVTKMPEAHCDEDLSVYAQMCTEIPMENASPSLKAVGLRGKWWQTGQTIRVKFMNGSKSLQNNVKTYAETWLQYANLKFEYVGPNDNADIKVAFKWDCDYSTWSFVGIDCKNVSQYKPTMNFGWLDDNTSQKEIRRVVLHEFGHALGLVHEHQHPENPIQWNKDKVYEYYKREGWNKETVDDNIFTKYSRSQTNYTDYDDNSIMLYAIDRSLTLNGYGKGWNFELSAIDKEFIGQIYPFSSDR